MSEEIGVEGAAVETNAKDKKGHVLTVDMKAVKAAASAPPRAVKTKKVKYETPEEQLESQNRGIKRRSPARAPAGASASSSGSGDYLKKDRKNLGGFNVPPPKAGAPKAGEIDISNHPSAVKELNSFAAFKRR
jgi:hypothetical protein